MTNKRTHGKKTISLIGSIAIVFILLSATTAVPQQTSSVVVDQLDKKQQLECFIDTFQNEAFNKEKMLGTASLVLSIVHSLLEKVKQDPNDIKITEEIILTAIPENVNVKDLIEETENTLFELQDTIDSLPASSVDSNTLNLDIPSLQSLISLLITFIQENLINGKSNGNSNGNSNGGLISILSNIFGVIISVISFLIQGIASAVSLLIGGIIKIITALISIVLLILGGIQTVLTIGAFFLIFLGFVSKIGLRIFSILGAPVFALLAAQFTISAGKLLGGLSMGLFSILGLLTFFALPILIVVSIIYLSGGNNGSDNGINGSNLSFELRGEGPVYMLISVLLNSLKE